MTRSRDPREIYTAALEIFNLSLKDPLCQTIKPALFTIIRSPRQRSYTPLRDGIVHFTEAGSY